MPENRRPSFDGERWAEIEELFHAARLLPANERDSFVAARCGGDESLRDVVTSLLNQLAGYGDLPRESMILPGLRGKWVTVAGVAGMEHGTYAVSLVEQSLNGRTVKAGAIQTICDASPTLVFPIPPGADLPVLPASLGGGPVGGPCRI